MTVPLPCGANAPLFAALATLVKLPEEDPTAARIRSGEYNLDRVLQQGSTIAGVLTAGLQ